MSHQSIPDRAKAVVALSILLLLQSGHGPGGIPDLGRDPDSPAHAIESGIPQHEQQVPGPTNPYDAVEFRRLQQLSDDGSFNTDNWAKAREQVKAMRSTSVAKLLQKSAQAKLGSVTWSTTSLFSVR